MMSQVRSMVMSSLLPTDARSLGLRGMSYSLLKKNLKGNYCDSDFKIPDFSHIAPAFCMQRQKTAKADANV